MSANSYGPEIKEIQVNNLEFPPGLLDFVLCQFRLSLKRVPYIKTRNVPFIWERLKIALRFSKGINAHFFLAPEYTLPFNKVKLLAELIKKEGRENTVYCIPVEHLSLKQLLEVANILNIDREFLDSCFPPTVDNRDHVTKLKSIFNVAVIAITDCQGNTAFYLQPKIFPAQFEENRNMPGYSFHVGSHVYIFQSPRLSFAVLICLDFIGWGGQLREKLIQWLRTSGKIIDFLFILQANPKPIHRDYERGLYFFANHPVCQYTSLFFVNCDSTSLLEDNTGKKIEGFNKSSVVGNFKIDYTNEYKVEKFIEIPPDKAFGIEILELDRLQRLMLKDGSERVVWLRMNTLRDTLRVPSYPRENDIQIHTFKAKDLYPVPLTTTFEYKPITGPLPDGPGIYRPITIMKPPIFVGRSQEFSRVLEFLKGEERCLLIHGKPGIGKSILAQHAVSLALDKNQQQFSAGLWFSSKDRHLSLKRFLTEFAISLDYPYLQQLSEDEQKSEVIYFLRDTLQGSAIIIVDNIETIRDPGVMSFIKELSKYAKVILTSRNHDTEIPSSKLEIGRMGSDDIKLLIQHRWPGMESLLQNRLLKLLNGSPFAVNLVFGYLISEGVTLNQILDDVEISKKNVIDWIFQKSWDSISPEEQQAIDSLQLFADTFTVEAFKFIAKFPQADKLLEDLKTRYFIEVIEFSDPLQFRYQIHPLVRRFSEKRSPKTSIKNRYVDYYSQFVKENCQREAYKNIDREIRNIEIALEICVKKKKNYLRIVSQLYYYYYERGFWNDAIEQCIKGYEYAEELGMPLYSLEMAAHVSWCSFRKEEFDLANKWLGKAKQALKKLERAPFQLRGLMEENEARIYFHDGKISMEQAEELIASAIKRYEADSSPEAVILHARALSYLGEMYLEQQNYQTAIEKFSLVKELIKKYEQETFSKKIRAWTEGNLGEALLLQTAEFDKRNEYLEVCINRFKKGLSLASEIQRQHTVAHCCWGLGESLWSLGRSEGRSYLTSAQDIYKRLGKKSKLKRIKTILKSI